MTLARGDRVCLRRLRKDDLRAFQAYRADAEVGRYQDWSPMSDPQAGGFLHHCETGAPFLPGTWTQIAVADAATDALLGDLGIHIAADGSEAELGITLARSAWGKGLAAAAMGLACPLIFGQSAAARIWAIADSRNARSLRLIRRAGFTFDREETSDSHGAPLTEHFFVMRRPLKTP